MKKEHKSMRHRIQREILLLLCLLAFVPVQGQTYEELWAQVEAAQEKGLVRTANRYVLEINRTARKEVNFPQALRSVLMNFTLMADVKPEIRFDSMVRMKKWMRTVSDPADKRVLHLVLGGMYLNQCNRVYRGTSYTEAQKADDPSKWDGPTFRRHALSCFDMALDDMDLLAHVDARVYEPMLVPGVDSRFFHDDLLSVMAEQVLEWTTEREHAYAINLYDRLIAYYAEAGNRDAEVWWKYARMFYVLEHDDSMTHDERLARYYKEVDTLLAEFRDTEIIPRIYEDVIYRSKDVKRTLRWTQEAVQRYPNYKRAALFSNALQQLTLPYLTVSVKDVQTLGLPITYEVSYRNIDTLRWELYDLADGQLVSQGADKLVVDKEFPYVYRDTVLSLPQPERPGHYKVRFSFRDQQHEAKFWFNRLSTYYRTLPDGRRQVFVLDRESGHPVSGARVICLGGKHDYKKDEARNVWYPYWDCKVRSEETTGEDGSVVFLPDSKQEDWGICAEKDGLGVTDTLEVSWFGADEEHVREKCCVFTDRAIYRPGQKVSFAGFLYKALGLKADVIPSRKLTVYLGRFLNNPIDTLTLETNEYGTFSGSFALPESLLPGRWEIRIPGFDKCDFEVEEYKRPTFYVEMDKLDDTYAVGDSIQLEGRAMNFSGAPVAHASVRYSVSAVPFWYAWLRISGGGRSLASGETITDADGRFRVPARLVDIRNAEEEDWYITYYVSAEVTAVAGETQSASRVIHVGNRSLMLELSSKDVWVKEQLNPVKIVAKNLSGLEVEAEGECVFYRVRKSGKPDAVKEDSVYSAPFSTKKGFMPRAVRQLPSGQYNLEFRTTDDMGRPVVEQKEITLFSMADRKIPVDKLGWYYIDKHKLGTGEETTLLLGTSAKDAYLIYDVFAKGKVLESKRIQVNDSLLTFRIADRPEYGDGITVTWFMIKHGEVFEGSESIPRTYSDRLQLKWKTFRDRLRPGGQEEWQLQVTDSEGRPADAELMATLYDASLDPLARLSWSLYTPRRNYLPSVTMGRGRIRNRSVRFKFEVPKCQVPDWGLSYWDELVGLRKTFLHKGPAWGTEVRKTRVALGTTGYKEDIEEIFDMVEDVEGIARFRIKSGFEQLGQKMKEVPSIRKDFEETAFFYPHLRTNEKGEITLSFTLPESVTTWRFLGLAHTRDVQYGFLEGEATASKEFMLQEYLPRYVRSGDQVKLSALLTNLSEKRMKGTVCMELFDPQADILVLRREQPFVLEGKGQATVSFDCRIPIACELLACRMTAENKRCSDGEQRYLPVLPKQEPLLTSRSFTLTKGGQHEWALDSLFDEKALSPDAEREFTFEFVSRPEWLAVSALPSLLAPASEDAVSLVAAYYACRLGGWLLRQHPALRRALTEWKNALAAGAESNPLRANSDLTDVVLEATPWSDALLDEAELQRRLSLLLDEERLDSQAAMYLSKVWDLHNSDNGISWTKGWQSNRTVTVVVTELLARLHHLTDGAYAKEYKNKLRWLLTYSGRMLDDEYKRFKTWEEDKGRRMYVYEVQMHDLYARSLLKDMLEDADSDACTYFYQRMKTERDRLTIVGRAAAVSIALARGEEDVAREFWQSLMEYSVADAEQGRYFNTPVSIASWTDCRIPTQVMVLEAGRALGMPEDVLSPFRQWLMLQKQTQSWDNPYHTANAVYALLVSGQSRFDVKDSSALRLDGELLGKGDEHRMYADVKCEKGMPSPKVLSVDMPDDGLAWGAVYLKSTPEGEVEAGGNGVTVERTLWVKRADDQGEEWREWTGEEVLKPGDHVRSCLQVSASRDLDFVQLTDRTAACLEPWNLKSHTVWSGNVCAYRAVKDASVDYFISYLTKGVHQWTTDYVVSRAGVYRLGVATLQSMYAPQWRAHTDVVTLTIEDARSEERE